MHTRRLKRFVIVACILAMGAGVVAGMVVSRLPAHSSEMVLPADHSELADELKLNETQKNQMRSIWEGVRTAVHDSYDQAQALQRQRDDAVIALLTPDQRAKYAELTNKTAEQFETLSAKRDEAFRNGVERTKQLLHASQRAEYERILRDRVGTVPSLTPNQLPGTGSVSGSVSGSSSESGTGDFTRPAPLSSSRPSD